MIDSVGEVAPDRQILDSCARTRWLERPRVGPYLGLGLVGLVVGEGLAVGLSATGGVTPVALVIAMVASVVGALIGIKISHIVRGFECLVYYEMLAASMAGSAAALALAGEALVPGLELVTIGVGTLLVFGRLGCLSVGCCHGRPARWGIRYGAEHGRAGFTRHYVGVRLFPVQLVAAAMSAVAAMVAVATYLAPHRPGEVVAAYLVSYGAGRFAVELGRGDPARPFALGLSYAQWISVTSAWATVAVAYAVPLAHTTLYAAVAVALSIASIALMLLYRPRGCFALGQPRAIAALDDTLRQLVASAGGDAPALRAIAKTGVWLSYQAHPDGTLQLSASREGTPLTEGCARRLLGHAQMLLRHEGDVEVIAGSASGVFHLLLHPSRSAA